MKRIITLFAVLFVFVGAMNAKTVVVDYNFNDGDKTGLGIYDVDKLTPSDFMQQIGFASGTTWILIKDSNTSTDMFVGSTSQYRPAGQANDWMVLPATAITSNGFRLDWKSQAFYANKRDGLKVFISTEGGRPEDFPTTPVWEVAEEEIGATEDYFEGEFISHSISLDEYVGETIYIAFVNQSYDKSLLCIDDIQVVREDGDFSIDMKMGNVVYEQEELTFTAEVYNYELAQLNKLYVELSYNGNKVTETIDNLNIVKGESAEFTLSHKAPIAYNETIEYHITATADGVSSTIAEYISSVSNVFRRRVVIEDHTGVWCDNCPAGIWALDSLKEVAPDNFAPISVQNNNGVPNPSLVVENYDAGLSAAGCMSFPSGWVNRTYVSHPWGNGQYNFEDENSWVSLFDKVMSETPEAGVKVEAYFNADKTWVTARAVVRTAETKENLDWRVIFVLTEDSVTGFYQNNKYSGMSQWVGGWQTKPRNVSMVFNDIARGIYPSFYGEKGSLPATIQEGDVVEYNYGIYLPYETVVYDKTGASKTYQVIQNADKLNLIAMVVDGETKQVINADMIRITDAPESVEGVVSETLQVKAFAENGVVTINTLSGENLTATLVAVDGRVLARQSARTSVKLDVAGYRGVALVEVVSNGKSVVKKVVIR